MSMYQSASRPEDSVTLPCTTASSTISSSSRSRSGCDVATFQGPTPRDEGLGGTGSLSIVLDPTEGEAGSMNPEGRDVLRDRVAPAAGTLAAAVAGGLATDPDSAWFRQLDKPSWYPPPATFGIVWSGLYAATAWAAGAVLAQGGAQRRPFARALAGNLLLHAAGTAPVLRRAPPRGGRRRERPAHGLDRRPGPARGGGAPPGCRRARALRG